MGHAAPQRPGDEFWDQLVDTYYTKNEMVVKEGRDDERENILTEQCGAENPAGSGQRPRCVKNDEPASGEYNFLMGFLFMLKRGTYLQDMMEVMSEEKFRAEHNGRYPQDPQREEYYELDWRTGRQVKKFRYNGSSEKLLGSEGVDIPGGDSPQKAQIRGNSSNLGVGRADQDPLDVRIPMTFRMDYR